MAKAKRFSATKTGGSGAQVNTVTGKALTTVAPKPSVAGASTTPTMGGSARGEDFAGAFGSSDTSTAIKTTKINTTPRSKSQLKNANFDLAGGSSTPTKTPEQLRKESLDRAKKIKKENERRKKITGTGKLASDNLRASQTNLTQNEATTTQGGRSSADTFSSNGGVYKTSKDGTAYKISGAGPDTLPSPSGRSSRILSDKEVADLGARGYFEGDFVPGEGRLLPNGTFDTRPLDQLNEIKKKALEVQNQYNALKQNDTSSAGAAVTSDTSAVKEEKKATESVAESAKESPIAKTLALLDQQMLDIKDQLRSDIKSINQGFDQTSATLAEKQQQETGQQSVQLANAGGYLGYAGSAQGVMLNLAESHRAELTALEASRQKAIAEAKKAASERKFDVVKEKANALQKIEEAAYDAELKYQAKVQDEKDKELQKQKDLQTESDIMAAIKGGAKDVESIFNKLEGKVDVATIGKLLKGITADVGDGFKFSASNNAALLGSGLGMDDIKALNEYINENGYDETARKNLTPSQRAALDKIFLPIQKVTGSKSTGKAMSVLDLDRIEESYGVRFPFGVTQGEVTQFFADNPGATPEEMQQAINESMGGNVGGGDTGGTKINVSKDWLSSNLSLDQQKKLADLVGASAWYTGKETDVNRMYNDPGLMQSLSNKIEELRKQQYSDDDILTALTS